MLGKVGSYSTLLQGYPSYRSQKILSYQLAPGLGNYFRGSTLISTPTNKLKPVINGCITATMAPRIVPTREEVERRKVSAL